MVDLSLLQDFIVETAEYLEEMEGGLLRLEADSGNRTVLDDIFRSVHTIKGAAEYLGIERIAELSRTIENMLYQQRRSELQVSSEVINLLREGRERIQQLVENLQQIQVEEIEIEDLVDRIRVVDTTSQISAVAGRAAVGEESELSDAEGDEYDEELFAIFLEQMEEKLTDLKQQIAALSKADPESRKIIIDYCLAQIEPLHASANYMGYSQLTGFYEKWKEEIKSTREKFSAAEDDEVISAFISDCMAVNIAFLMSRYPQLQIPEFPEALAPVAPVETHANPGLPDAVAEILTDSGAADFGGVGEGDILEEYAENSATVSVPESDVKVAATGNDANLFEQLSWSFDSRIKQTVVKLPEENLTEIESELFSSQRFETEDHEALFEAAASDAVPVSETLRLTDNYEEENDAELFTIFQEQLQDELTRIKELTASLSEVDNDRIVVLDSCLEKIERLGSAANYMGYDQLVTFYEIWAEAVAVARGRLQDRDESFLPSFIADCMQGNISALIRRFPQLKLLQVESFSTETAALPEPSMSVSASAATPPQERLQSPAGMSKSGSLLGDAAVDLGSAESSRQTSISDLTLLPDFIAETREHLEEMEGNLLQLSQNSGKREILDDIFRSVHTIKGAAEYLGIARIAELSHNLENLLYQLRQNQLTVTSEVTALLMAGWDRISLLTGNLEQTQIESAEINDLLVRLCKIGGSDRTAVAEKSDLESPYDESQGVAGGDIERVAAALKAENATLLQGTDRRQVDERMRRQSDHINEKIVKHSIRVDAGKIDALMNQVGELVVSRAGFSQLLSGMQQLQQDLKQKFKLDVRELRQLAGMTSRLSEATTLFDKVTNELQEEVMKIRMLPISQLFNRYPRLVFDLVRDTGKKVELDIHGEETELDKMVIEEISDPLIHIIRNAVDHGIETTAVRWEKGKPEIGTIRLQAYHEGNHVVIEIIDDGRGLDLEHIKDKALAGDFLSQRELERMSDQEVTELIMLPGFSTAASVTHISGRGVGMDVVRKNIEKLNGTIEIESVPDVETRFRIKIPLTLAIIPALRIKVASELFTIPLSTVEETLRIFPDQISTIEGVEVMSFRGSTLPLVHMADLFNLKGAARDRLPAYVVVVSTGMKRMGLIVDALLRQEEVVIKPLEDYIQEKSGFSGATILGDGRISLILDVYELINISMHRQAKNRG